MAGKVPKNVAKRFNRVQNHAWTMVISATSASRQFGVSQMQHGEIEQTMCAIGRQLRRSAATQTPSAQVKSQFKSIYERTSDT